MLNNEELNKILKEEISLYPHLKDVYNIKNMSYFEKMALYMQINTMGHFAYLSDEENYGVIEDFRSNFSKLINNDFFVDDCDGYTTTTLDVNGTKPFTVVNAKYPSREYVADKNLVHMVTSDHYIGGIVDFETNEVYLIDNTSYDFAPKALKDINSFLAIQDMPTYQKLERGFIIPRVHTLKKLQKGYMTPEVRGKGAMISSVFKQYKMEQFIPHSEPRGSSWYLYHSEYNMLKDFVENRGLKAREYTFTKEWKANFVLNKGLFKIEANFDSDKKDGEKFEANLKIGKLQVGSIKASEEDGISPIMIKKKIALLVGHRKGSQGAKNVDGITEYAYWKTWIEQNLLELPKQHEYKIFLREDDDGRGYRERMRAVGKRAGEWDAQLILSFHFNASRSSKAEGFEVLTTTNQNSQEYGRHLLDFMDREMAGDNRGLKVVKNDVSVRGSGFLYKTPMTALLIEPFFGTSYEDVKAGRDGSFLSALTGFLNNI